MLGYFADVMAVIMFGVPLMLLGDVVKTWGKRGRRGISGFPSGVPGLLELNLTSSLNSRRSCMSPQGGVDRTDIVFPIDVLCPKELDVTSTQPARARRDR
ncbi:hypothetical protein KRP22_010971 [Phytophthora ramorum]|nr:hypothetical protein KRP22_5157 [Phytophthora ramorum]